LGRRHATPMAHVGQGLFRLELHGSINVAYRLYSVSGQESRGVIRIV
jgi:hypothetical protein